MFFSDFDPRIPTSPGPDHLPSPPKKQATTATTSTATAQFRSRGNRGRLKTLVVHALQGLLSGVGVEGLFSLFASISVFCCWRGGGVWGNVSSFSLAFVDSLYFFVLELGRQLQSTEEMRNFSLTPSAPTPLETSNFRSQQDDNKISDNDLFCSIGSGRFTSRRKSLFWKGWCVTSHPHHHQSSLE